jgi:hypothetical protein
MSPSMASMIGRMTAQCHGTRDKIDTLYHWLQQNMRYVSVQLGIGGWQSFEAAYVEKNRFGDCKALSTFMKGMLKEVGIESYLAILKWDEEEALFMDDFINIDFNHMMLFIPDELLWLECTSNDLDPGQINRDEENKIALLITPEGGVITKTPSTPSDLNCITILDTISLSDKWIIRGEKTYSGNLQDEIKSFAFNLPAEKQRNYFLEHNILSIQKLDLLSIKPDPINHKTKMQYTATLSQFGSSNGNRYFISINSIYPVHFTCTDHDRLTDFLSKDDYLKTTDVFISIPPDYAIEYLPSDSHFEFNGNHYSSSISSENNFIHIHYQLIESPLRLDPARYRELCEFYDSIAKANRQTLVLKSTRA